jgi:hypothetical protein
MRRSGCITGSFPSFPKVHYRLRPLATTILIVASVKEVLSARLPLCLNCVVQRASRRIGDVIREIDAMTLRFVEGRCIGCTQLGAVVSRPEAHSPLRMSPAPRLP